MTHYEFAHFAFLFRISLTNALYIEIFNSVQMVNRWWWIGNLVNRLLDQNRLELLNDSKIRGSLNWPMNVDHEYNGRGDHVGREDM